MKNFLLIITFFISSLIYNQPAEASGPPTPSRNDACVYTASGLIERMAAESQCEVTPDTQSIKIYSIKFCRSLPTAPTASSAIGASMCEDYFTNTSGAVANIEKGRTNSLIGEISEPPSGVYTHAMMELDPTFTFKSSLKFNGAVTDTNGNTNTVCRTKSVTSRDPHFNTGSSDDSTDQSGVLCDNGTPETLSLTMNALDFNTGLDNECAMSHSYQGSDALVPVHMVLSNGKLGAIDCGTNGNASNNISRIYGIVPVNINWTQGSGQTVNIRYNNTRGMQISWDDTTDNLIRYLHGAFFDVSIKVRTPRKRNWR